MLHFSLRSAAVQPRNCVARAEKQSFIDGVIDMLEGGRKLRRWYGSDSSVGDGTRVDDDPWEISAINSLEVTLRDTDSVKHKIQLAQLRSGRHAFKHAGRRPAENAW